MSTASFKPGSNGVLQAGRYIIALGLIVFGVQHILYKDFITGRAPSWPYDSAALQIMWAYLSGALFITTGILLALNKKARLFLIACALLTLLWAVLRHLPILTEIHFRWGGELTNGGKALTLFGGLLGVAALLPYEHTGIALKMSGLINRTSAFTLTGRYCMGIFLVVCGYEHFLFVEFVKTLVPDWIPGNIFWTYLTGIALIAGGLGLFIPKTASLAGGLIGIMIFIWFVMLHLPRAFATHDQNEWTAAAEAFTFSGIAFTLTRK